MTCFQLPKELCAEIDSMIARFWWGSISERKKISWEKMAKQKRYGGMGFREFHIFNLLIATKHSQSSYRWTSLLFGCDLL